MVSYKGKYIEYISDELIGIVRVIPEEEFYSDVNDKYYTIFSFETEDEAFRKEILLLKTKTKTEFESNVLNDAELYEDGKQQSTNDALKGIEFNGIKTHD